jgi:cytochrome c556
MKQKKIFAFAVAMVLLMSTTRAQKLSENTQVQGMGADDTSVLYRQSVFFMMQVHLNQLKDMTTQKTLYQPDIFKATAQQLQQLSRMSNNAFEVHSKQGYDIPSNAVEGIWDEQEKYNAAHDKLLQATSALVKASESQELNESVSEAVLQVAQSCKSCHDDFRAK